MSYKHNILGFCCLDDENHKKIFGYDTEEIVILNPNRLKSQELEKPEEFPDKPLPELPSLPYGDDIEEYFHEVAQKHFDRYDLDSKIEELLTINLKEVKGLKEKLPILIDYTKANVWTKMDGDGNLTEVEVPDSNALIFDTETYVTGSDCNSPIVAQALGKDYEGKTCLWMWLHPLFGSQSENYVPMKVRVGNNKLLVGHNFAFDRQKIVDFYTLNISSNIIIDTMAMMKQVGGLNEQQTWATRVDPLQNRKAAEIQKYGCAMGLVPSYEWITRKSLPDDAKKLRDIFVKAKSFQEFRETRQDILTYSMLDVIYNWELFVGVYPRYMEMTGHKAILAGQSIVIDSIIPHIDYWDEWVERCDTEYLKIERQIFDILFPKIQKIHSDWLVTGEYPEQLDILNWNYVRPFRHRKDKPLPEGWPLKATWYKPWEKEEIKLKGRDLQILLQCQFKYRDKWYDVQYTRKDAYHILVDQKVVKLPNRKKPGANYGSILSADSLFITDREEPLLRSKLLSDEMFLKVLKLFDLTTTYTGFRQRVVSQNRENGLVGAEVNPCGTISGRTVSRLYNTLPAHWDEPKIMSEIKMTSQCPDGYVFVGGDADAQEASIAAAMADHYYGVSGASEFSKAVIIGNKKDQTDYHSLTAKAMTEKDEVTDDERGGGKGINFSLIYGAGVRTAAQTIKFFFDDDDAEAFRKARKAVEGFKGTRKEYDENGQKIVDETSEYTGGIASHVFNKMSDIIRMKPPKGLFFNNEWPKSLQPDYCKKDGTPAQLNYCIQASCSTYGFLSAWVLGVMDEIHRHNLDARFSISIHDEVWFICKEEHAEKLAFLIMVCYSRVWALLHNNLLIADMPVKRAFPSSISIDPILRKSPKASTKTPSFDEMPSGREVDIYHFLN